ncbi:ATP-binding protein [Teredinibacter waterburyi]|uniref:ATP-binding protein n=1 Tax=Teredinibacter waterburyi TaxID=1500538 RepID=UPI00165FEEEF|nr:ATP-binding protein [Teredinibacter waterburyi]
MKLRSQLVIVSLITLTLPWLGVQYVRELDGHLRNGQVEALNATAKAVAARFASDSHLLAQQRHYAVPVGAIGLYVHKLSRPMILDGYDEDWQSLNLNLQHLDNSRSVPKTTTGSTKMIAGVRANIQNATQGQILQLFFKVEDGDIRYHNPTLPSPLFADHLRLQLVGPQESKRTLLVYASGPGSLQVSRALKDGTLQREFGVSGNLVEWQYGYQIELHLPLNWANQAFGIEIFDVNNYPGAGHPTSDNLGINGELPPLLIQSDKLTRELTIFQREGVRLRLTTPQARLVAESGALDTELSAQLASRHGLLTWLFNRILGAESLPELDTPETTGLIETPEISAALLNLATTTPRDTSSHALSSVAIGKPSSGWYRLGKQRVVRVAVPVIDKANNNQVVALVIADQSADSLAQLAGSALYRLLTYSLVTTTAVGVLLLLYASWLSLRIRKLSRAAQGAISDRGQLVESFPVFSSEDEIGDLSRSYAQLLKRLQEYTQYLRTLASKLSHELRTPLAIVQSSLYNLEYESLSDEAKAYAQRANEGSQRLQSILNAMSSASRVEQAIDAAELETVSCEQLLTNLVAAYADTYTKVRFELVLQPPSGDFTLQASADLLVQMLDKLVDNAVDFSEPGNLVTIILENQPHKQLWHVHNDGPPLPAQMQSQLFDSLVSVRASGASQHLGLGLYIVRLIAEFHGGKVTASNAPEGGVTFTVDLPTNTKARNLNS